MMVGHGDGDDCDGHSDYDDADVKQSACCGCLGGWAAVCCLCGSGGCAGLTEPVVVHGDGGDRGGHCGGGVSYNLLCVSLSNVQKRLWFLQWGNNGGFDDYVNVHALLEMIYRLLSER